MKNNLRRLNKIIVCFLMLFILCSNVAAKPKEIAVGSKVKIEKDGNTYIVVSVNNDSDRCPIVPNPEEPKVLKVTSSYFDTIGYTYENTCQHGEQVCTETWTKAVKDKAIFDAINNTNTGATPGSDATEAGTDAIGSIGSKPWVGNVYGTSASSASSASLTPLISINKSRFNIMKVSDTYFGEYYSPDGSSDILYGDYPVKSDTSLFTTNGGIAAAAAKLNNYGYRVVYFDECGGQKVRGCHRYVPSHCIVSGKRGCLQWSEAHWEYDTHYGDKVTKKNWPSTDNTSPTSLADFFDKEVPEPAACSDGYEEFSYTKNGHCGEAWYRAKTRTCKWVCTKSGPSKVEVYGVRLKVKINNIDGIDAYCVTPAAGYNKSYAWDTTFDASKCKNSLQMYKVKDGKTTEEYDLDCGYSYILAEAHRLNEVIKEQTGKDNYFNYGVIDFAMKLFGTGITGNGMDLGTITGKEYLQAGGYYTRYYGYSGSHEYVGIPWIRDNINRSGWPSIYRYFLPEFYSIYIRTARVVRSYLKGNYRLADVGNIEKSKVSGNVLTEIVSKDGQKVEMVIDPFEYLLPRQCKETFEDCSQSKTTLEYNDKFSQTSVDMFIPMDGTTLDYLKDAGPISTKCKNQSSLGVLCGLKNEKGNADYIKSIYLYIRALQGNEIVYEKKVENANNEYKPIDGLTKVLYEVDANGEASTVIRYAIDTKVTTESSVKEVEVDCDWTNPDTKDYCKAEVFVFDANGNVVHNTDHYDYCKKNYCYVKVKSSMICRENQENSKITSLVVTEPNIKSTVIKKISNGQNGEQTIFVYDIESKVTGGYCQEIEAIQEGVSVKCPCKPSEHPNVVVPSGNIEGENNCSKTYNAYDQLYYGDPSMSTIINACYEEDKLKYDYTDDLNINGNDIVYDAELESKYSFQVKSDDFNVCKLYCRDESRFYIANKISVKAGQNLKYDVGQTLIDKKIINETAKDKGILDNNKQDVYNYMPSVVLQLRECTSEIDYDKWETLYNSAKTKKEKNQLLYSIYNCNLYTTDEIKEKISENKLTNIFEGKTDKYVGNANYAESAMIEYKYNTSDGTITIENDYGTTKDYLLSQEGCTSLGLNQTDCASYFLTNYSDDYYNSLGVSFDFEHGLVDSNLNETIYCSGESCYKLPKKDGSGYVYNPYSPKLNDYTTQDDTFDGSGNIKTHESGKILNYDEWGLHYQDYDKDSSKYTKKTIKGVEVPTNEYASFVVVTETGFYNKKQYYAKRYSGIISIEPPKTTNESIALDKNILPLHLNKKTGSYTIEHKFNSTKTAYKRNKYYTEKNYTLFDNINQKPGEFHYICTYDVYNTTTEYEADNSKRGLGFTYRVVNLNDVFESVTNNTREYPENWATSFGQNTLAQIQSSASNILEPDNNSNDVDSYLEYSYTLTPEGIKRIREYNKSKNTDNGYLNESLYDCLYDEDEKIFYNCKSTFLTNELNDLNGKFTGLIKINKGDGVSEFCSSKENENEDFCKYQYK